MSGKINFQIDVYRTFTTRPEAVVLSCGQSLFVGSGESCGIKLEGVDVAQFHCRIEIREQDVVVQDCGTGESTRINGQAIEDDVSCHIGDTIEIGECRLVIACVEETEDGTRVEPEVVSVTAAHVEVPGKVSSDSMNGYTGAEEIEMDSRQLAG